MKQILITLSLILGINASVSADDKAFAINDAFSCQMKAIVMWDWNTEMLTNGKLEKFYFIVADANSLDFGSNSFCLDCRMKIIAMHGNTLIAERLAGSQRMALNKKQNRFNFTSQLGEKTNLVAATCERF